MLANCPGYSTQFDPTTIFRRILIPADFGPQSRRALATACETRRRYGSEIRLFFVRESGDDSASRAGPCSPWLRQGLDRAACGRLRGLAESVCNGTPCISYDAAQGDDVVRAIAHAVRRYRATVVFLPCRPGRARYRFRAERIIRAIDVPVFILNENDELLHRQAEVSPRRRRLSAEKPVILSPSGRLIANPRWQPLVNGVVAGSDCDGCGFR